MAEVLLIEDDDTQRFIAAFALRKAGHAVREAADGASGLAAARELVPDVIVCDVLMPGMTGYGVLDAVRADPALATVPVVLLTAMSDRRHMRLGMSAGADDYLTKPYRPDELCEAIRAVLERRALREKVFRDSLSGALEEQKETLARNYETRLQREIDARGARAQAAGDLHYPQGLLLLVDLLVDGGGGASEAALAERVKQAQRTARDTLYMFGASHVLPYGPRIMAVFSGEDRALPTPPALRVLRAAVALVKAAGERPVTVAIHAGAVALVAVHDALHGEQGHALVPGDAVNAVEALEELASARRWRIAASQPLADALRAHADLGRHGRTARGDPAVDVLGLSAA